MSFALVETIYANLSHLMEIGQITFSDRCETTAIEYCNLRIKGLGNLLHKLFLALQNTDKKDSFPAYYQLCSLVYSLEENKVDNGLYWVIFSDSNRKEGGEEVLTHVLLLEKRGDSFCLIQTYVNIGNRRVVGLPFCHVNGKCVREMFENIARLLSCSERVIYWTEEKWYRWLSILSLPQTHKPDNLRISHPRVIWDFIPLSSFGCLYELGDEREKNNFLELLLKLKSEEYESKFLEQLVPFL